MNPDVFDRVLAERDALRQELDAARALVAQLKELDDLFTRALAQRDALQQERDAALLALSELCESCGGKEPHTLAHCTAHLKKTLTDLRPPETPK